VPEDFHEIFGIAYWSKDIIMKLDCSGRFRESYSRLPLFAVKNNNLQEKNYGN